MWNVRAHAHTTPRTLSQQSTEPNMQQLLVQLLFIGTILFLCTSNIKHVSDRCKEKQLFFDINNNFQITWTLVSAAYGTILWHMLNAIKKEAEKCASKNNSCSTFCTWEQLKRMGWKPQQTYGSVTSWSEIFQISQKCWCKIKAI